jgi:hypothetical protein
MIRNYRTLDLPADYDRIFDPPGFHKGRVARARVIPEAETASVGGHKWQTRIGQAAVCEACHTRASGATIGTQCAGGAR